MFDAPVVGDADYPSLTPKYMRASRHARLSLSLFIVSAFHFDAACKVLCYLLDYSWLVDHDLQRQSRVLEHLLNFQSSSYPC